MDETIVAVTGGENAGPRVPRGLFGTNILFARDRLGTGETDDVIALLDASDLRFPGGTIAETEFDLTDPDGKLCRETTPTTTLSDFLAFAAAEGARATLVVPTIRAMTETTPGTVTEAEIAAVTDFVTAVLRGDFGAAEIFAFEIGNEFQSALTAAEYAEVAATFADAIAGAIAEFAASPDAGPDFEAPRIAVQAGRTAAENETIQAHFAATGAIDAVDLIVTHDYPWNAEAVVTPQRQRRYELLKDWQTDFPEQEIDLMISEWNIGAPRGEDGLLQAAGIVAMFDNMARHGVAHAHVWPVQHNTQNALAGPLGPVEMRPAGFVFAALRAVEGTAPIAVETGRTDILGFGFADPTRVFLLLCSRSDAAMALEADLSALLGAHGDIRGAVIGAESAGDPTPWDNPRADGTLTDLAPGAIAGGALRVTLAPHEIVVLEVLPAGAVFAPDSPATEAVFGDGDDVLRAGPGDEVVQMGAGADRVLAREGADDVRGGAGDDVLIGGAGSDRLRGDAGDDVIHGDDGADALFGNAGDDRLKAGRGDDYVLGEAGDDYISGFRGADSLLGGAGDDRIFGGLDDDRIDPGAGDDRILLGPGRDLLVYDTADFGEDRVLDFRPGSDRVDFSAAGLTGLGDLVVGARAGSLALTVPETGARLVLVDAAGALSELEALFLF